MIGILALQGAFEEHGKCFSRLGEKTKEIRQKKDFSDVTALVIPGGESTVISKLLQELDLYEVIRQAINDGMCVFGTCAGMILLGSSIEQHENNSKVVPFSAIEMTVSRNAYGRQLSSFQTRGTFSGEDCEMVFIRGPIAKTVADDVEILSVVDENIVAVRQGNCLATAFHPELTNDLTVHQYFLDMIHEGKK
ncbi:pyridoxal phosphate synthase yaaE subunit [Pilibacter termitis]|uniref:Pyridoxal 5'-phosphate synthase subunit PdxT n=1 Tax=Pilibacter termitis TaxID=263852 RepID=A0A1T4MPY3_9ENTE|nr:pyridoxal 5'-phosphate synthase glutaminase subunit PdxT [Pilibacter termitis]SJZ68824.1 pyridoxal phosphate synthase yaaE subunit [Pilibacter termitis]